MGELPSAQGEGGNRHPRNVINTDVTPSFKLSGGSKKAIAEKIGGLDDCIDSSQEYGAKVGDPGPITPSLREDWGPSRG